MPVRWKHKPFPRDSMLEGLCLGLVGAGFNSIFRGGLR